MIVVDTSALIEIALVGPRATECAKALATAEGVLLSAGTLSEANIVGWGKRIDGLPAAIDAVVASIAFDVVGVDAAVARRIGDVYARWGKGSGAKVLNWGDCFAYALAMERNLPLLFIGDDFAQTDAESVLKFSKTGTA